ncbi:MAG: NADH-quinone oxidoreductase subunit NuoG [Syntrophobacteraceae bacterium]|nr:NADH-quinone oxidoreductase subunit NuoG [Syntrophobacteraceae bacterium]
MATILIDGRPYEVKDGQNLLQACLTLGFNVPYFCWHPALGSIGACRQCAVKRFKNEKDTGGEIVMACMTPAEDSIRISIDDPEAVGFRASVIEWLMLNHPHDCPVCDEGGECHLQDMTVMTGHAYRENRFRKRTYRNQDLGPFVNHEMNRCIQCYRCVRYYRTYAGGGDLNVFSSHDHLYFGRSSEGRLQNDFSGNLVEICPTGVFTDKTLKNHYTRKWDMETAPSVCVHCSLGCNTIPGARYGKLRRVRNRYNRDVNGYFLCDRGRYGYEFVNGPLTVQAPLAKTSRAPEPVALSGEEALARAAAWIANSPGVIGIGSPRASIESNFALRTLVGPDNFYAGLSDKDFEILNLAWEVLRNGVARTPPLSETAQADAVFVLGEDAGNTSPVLALNLRQLARRKAAGLMEEAKIPTWNDSPITRLAESEKGALYLATPCATSLDDMALKTFHAAPPDLGRLGFAVASVISPANAPKVADLIPEELRLAEKIARALKSAARPLIVSGAGSKSRTLIEAAANICTALRQIGRPAQIILALPEANSLGLAMLGASGGIETASGELLSGRAATVIVLENNLFRRCSPETTRDLWGAAKHVIAIDHIVNATTSRAELVLPAASFAQSSGTMVNNEGRAQRFFRVFSPKAPIKESWRWMRDIMGALWRPEAAGWHGLDDLIAAIAAAIPVFSALPSAAPGADFRRAGGKVPRQSHRYSGRTAILAQIDVDEPKAPEDPDTPLAFSMEGDHRQPPSALIPKFWAPGWNSIQSLNRFQQEIGGPLRGGDPGVRLIEPSPQAKARYFTAIPARQVVRVGKWVFVPLHHVFGSEELSALSPGVAGLCPKPYVALHPEDAAALGITEGGRARVDVDGSAYDLSVRMVPTLSRGVAGLPVGLPGGPALDLPASGKVSRGIADE